jgi:hypothetical protein
LRHLRFALPQYLLKFLSADLTSSSAAEYAIAVIVRHAFLLSAFGLHYGNPENQMECLTINPMRINPVSNWHPS